MRIIIIFLSLFIVVAPIKAQITWTQIPSGTEKDLKTIQFLDDQIGYIGGDSILLTTIDGGANWTEVQIDSINIQTNQVLDIYDMHWFSVQHGIIMSGTWGGMFETYNGGTTWQSLGTASAGFCQFGSVFYFDENHGFAGGAGCFEGHIIDRFENGTWSTTMDPEDWDSDNLVISIEFKDTMVGFAGTLNGTILRTADGGFNWDTIPTAAPSASVTDFAFYGGDTIRATHTADWGVLISFDNGLTWEYDSETATFYYPRMEAIHIDGNGTTFIGGIESNSNTQGVIFDNHGPFWNYNTIGHRILDITSHSDSVTFLVGDTGAIYVNVDPGTLTTGGVIEAPMFEVWPNPVINQLNITGMDEPIKSCSVIDINGRILQHENGNGTGQSLDVSRLECGMYFLQIETESGRVKKEFVKN